MFLRLFFPEGLDIYENTKQKTAELREKRKISITKLNPLPVCDPAREILFTSNILITIPDISNGMQGLAAGPALKRELEQLAGEEQKYWYDHPVPVGVPLTRMKSYTDWKDWMKLLHSKKGAAPLQRTQKSPASSLCQSHTAASRSWQENILKRR